MKNLWHFFIRFNAVIWFLLFFIFALILVIRNNEYQKSYFINSSNEVVGSFYKELNYWKGYLALDKVNQELVEENALLHKKLAQYNLLDTTSVSQDIIQVDSLDSARYLFIPAKIANNSIKQKNNYITLSKGSKHGIQEGMGVISSSGIVGFVLKTSSNFSTVQSLLHTDTRVSVTIDSLGVFGSLVWGDNQSSNHAYIREIPSHVLVSKGQKVFTSGFSTFPEGIQVGIIEEVEKSQEDSFLRIKIKLSNDFATLARVYVVEDLQEDEQQELEELQNNG